MNDYDYILKKLSYSKFRSSFHLKEKDKEYINNKGWDLIRSHAKDFVSKRLASKNPINDGKQTPMRGHPVFIAEHATATCCRSCLEKWHHIKKNHALSKEEQEYIVNLIICWLEKEMEKRN